MTMRALLRDPDSGQWMAFDRPRIVVSANRASEVVDVLRRVEREVEDHQLTAVGFVAYEAAPAFDTALRVRPSCDRFPLAAFGLFEAPTVHATPPLGDVGAHEIGEWDATETETVYSESIRRIRDHIARGDTYQVNHTFRLRADFSGDPRGLFLDLIRAQPDCYATYLDLGSRAICSASPELLLRLDGDRLISRPMKGTANRGWDLPSDRRQMEWLRTSEKNCAENTMIVDMVRSDLGRVAATGSVEVTRLFDVERHPTVLQMTSTVTAVSDAAVTDILATIFPFASVTGAPKIRTTEIISELETEPRGIYTGAIGWLAPERKACFSVGIRTAVVDLAAGEFEYGVGSGIVWDSVAEDEYGECVAKARILSEPTPDFDLLETILWQPGEGLSLLDRHLDRLQGAAEYFCRSSDRQRILRDLCAVASTRPLRVRLLVAADGSHSVEVTEIDDVSQGPIGLGLARTPVEPDDPFLHFKTTHRKVYENARRSRPDCDDVLLWNDRGEVTESTVANVVARIGGRLVTPPTECGLLAGTFRAELLERGEITERIIRVDELADAEELLLVNSVQGWRKVEWMG